MRYFLITVFCYCVFFSVSFALTIAGKASEVSREGNVITIKAFSKNAHIYAVNPGDLGLPLKINNADNTPVKFSIPAPQELKQDNYKFYAYTGEVKITINQDNNQKILLNYGVCDKQCIEEKVAI